MALALGLGSLFNHSGQPNVSFSIDSARECITYTSARTINPDEELCIFYGHKLWFDPVDDVVHTSNSQCEIPGINDEADPWGGLARIQGNTADVNAGTSTKLHKSIDELVEEEDLPFTWIKLSLQKEEEQIDDIELAQSWVVDIPEQKHIATMLKWLKQSGLDGDSLSHLKRIRRQGSSSSLLLDTSQVPPELPPDIGLSAPYQLPVPCHPALTETSLRLKNTFWPTVYAPKRKWEPEKWTVGKIRWASDAMNHLKKESAKVTTTGELSIVAYVPKPYEDDAQGIRPFVAHDTRTSTRHPLRHAALNVIRKVADFRAQQLPTKTTHEEAGKNGAQYLLTGLSLFITHEPCIMCAMALLHSRVKEVFYLVPMPKTGGCGGAACVPSLKGVNHRFSIAVWKHSLDDGRDLPATLASEIDA
ncbi:cytidine deaminase-like protein [Paxillus ammoniavirescens]|nr:cytidine deaminase-like protein [Paxillus ammoniavirescens]